MTPLQITKTASHTALLALCALSLSWLGGCSSPPPAPHSVKPSTKPSAQPPANTPPISPPSQAGSTPQGAAVEVAPGTAVQSTPAARGPAFSLARNAKDYRHDAAKHLYALHRPQIYQGRLPPMLEAVGVLNVDIDKKGAVKNIHWTRAPRHVPQVMKEIEHLVKAAAPYPVPQHLSQVTYTDVWLWHQSGKFQLDALTEGQD